MLKKISMIMAIVVFICLITNSSFASTPSIYIEDVVKKENEEKVTMNVYLENVESNIGSISFGINYDESKLEYVSSKSGKNLKATVKMSEYIDENNKLSITIMSSSGLKVDGVYYQITFNVLDDTVSEIPVNLELKETLDVNGNSIKCNSNNGVIRTKETETSNDSNNNQTTINPFEKTDIDSSDSLNDIINENTTPDISNKNITYDVEDEDILKISNNGTMVPLQDGTTTVTVLADGEEIGVLDVEVENGKVKKISSESVENKTSEQEDISETNTSEKTKKTSVTENGKNINPLILIIILIVIIAIIVIYKKTKAKKEKKYGKSS